MDAMLTHFPATAALQDTAGNQIAHEAARVRAIAHHGPNARRRRMNIDGCARFAAVTDPVGSDNWGRVIVRRKCREGKQPKNEREQNAAHMD